MKRLILLAAFALPALGCTGPAEAPTNANAVGNTNAAVNTNTAPAPAVSETVITDHEKQIWDALQRRDYAAFGALLDETMTYVSSDGVFDKAGTINGVKNFEPTNVTLSDWQVLSIDADAAIVVYKVTTSGKANGQPLPANMAQRAASVWVRRGDKWLAVFHQDTEVKPAPATPSANANKADASSTPAAATPAAATASPATTAEAADPVTKEKQLWEELRNKNWAAFASDLADNAIEVEPEGVFDKAGSIEGVKGVDFSKYTLAGFKEIKIDPDASIVTYETQSGGREPGQRSSTVWVKRGDRWYALLHVGTPIMQTAAK